MSKGIRYRENQMTYEYQRVRSAKHRKVLKKYTEQTTNVTKKFSKVKKKELLLTVVGLSKNGKKANPQNLLVLGNINDIQRVVEYSKSIQILNHF